MHPEGSLSTRTAPASSIPHFLIVGTPRSGTTLIQRLVCEIPSVRVPPETHFLGLFLPDLLLRVQFPLAATAYVEEIQRFRRLRTSKGLNLDAQRLVWEAGGICRRPIEMFGAILDQLTGSAQIVGEKTPDHLRWWQPVNRALPETKFIAVIRDPRAVVSSNLRVPFGMKSSVLLAEKWTLDRGEIEVAERKLGPARWLTVRYEDVVDDPEGARAAIRVFLLGTDYASEATNGTGERIFMPWEAWKSGALGPVRTDRIDAWRDELAPRDLRAVLRVCRGDMARYGYDPGPVRGSIPPADRWRRVHYRIARRRRMRWINSVQL